MYLKNHEIRDRNLEICQIHHKRKVYNDIVSTPYTLFYIREIKSQLFGTEMSGSFEDFPTHVLFLYKFFQHTIFHGFLKEILIHKSDIDTFIRFIFSKGCAESL